MSRKKNDRWYVLRVSHLGSLEASLYLFGGLTEQEKSLTAIKQEAKKAFRAGYTKIFLPWNFIFHSEKEKLVSWILEDPKTFILSVHKKSLKNARTLFKDHSNLSINLALEDYDNQLLKELEERGKDFQVTIPAHKKVSLEILIENLKSRYKNSGLKNLFQKQIPPIFIHFPCSHKIHSELYKAQEIYHFLKKNFYPPPPLDIYNLSIPKDLELEPEREVEFSYNIQKDFKEKKPQSKNLF